MRSTFSVIHESDGILLATSVFAYIAVLKSADDSDAFTQQATREELGRPAVL